MLYVCIPDTSAWAVEAHTTQPGCPSPTSHFPSCITEMLYRTNHPPLRCDSVACSRHCLPSHLVLQPLAHSHRKKKPQDQFFPCSQPLKYLMPFWHSGTYFPFCPPCPSDFQYFQVFLLDFRNTMKINSVFLTVLVYYSDFSCWSTGN